MSFYTITFTRPARKEFEKLSLQLETRIFKRIEYLGQEPRPTGCQKLRGQNDLWRIRIGDYRVIYKIDDLKKVVDIIGVRHRKHAYD